MVRLLLDRGASIDLQDKVMRVWLLCEGLHRHDAHDSGCLSCSSLEYFLLFIFTCFLLVCCVFLNDSLVNAVRLVSIFSLLLYHDLFTLFKPVLCS